jgi:protein TonB
VSNTAASPQASAKNPDRPRLVSKVDYQGRRPNPVYPRASERRREQGRVVVRVLISAQGTVSQVSVQSSSGYDRLDEAALKAARTARFKPYMENGIAYQALADIPFDFVL